MRPRRTWSVVGAFVLVAVAVPAGAASPSSVASAKPSGWHIVASLRGAQSPVGTTELPFRTLCASERRRSYRKAAVPMYLGRAPSAYGAWSVIP